MKTSDIQNGAVTADQLPVYAIASLRSAGKIGKERTIYGELAGYSPLVTPGSHFIMEDTNIPIEGPRQAVEAFLPQHPEFEADATLEKFFLTLNPGGYLRRKF